VTAWIVVGVLICYDEGARTFHQSCGTSPLPWEALEPLPTITGPLCSADPDFFLCIINATFGTYLHFYRLGGLRPGLGGRQAGPVRRQQQQPQHHQQHHQYTTGEKLEVAQKKSGIYGPCWLAYLHLFNVIWDITGDMMHLLKGTWGRRYTYTIMHQKAPARSILITC
jgi:hypothetical protein